MLQPSPPLDPGLEFKLLCSRPNFNTLYTWEFFLYVCVKNTYVSFNSHSLGERISQVLTTQEGKSSFKDILAEQLANLTETKRLSKK